MIILTMKLRNIKVIKKLYNIKPMNWVIKGIGGGSDIFFTKYYIRCYMKAWSTNYKPVFIESKNLI